MRQMLFHGELPPLQGWGLHLAAGLGLAGVGWWFFHRVRPGFADVL